MAERSYLVMMVLDEERAMFRGRYNSPREVWRDVNEVLVVQHHLRATLLPGIFWKPDRGTPIDCILAAQDLAERLPWLREAVQEMRLLRVEDDADLIRALPRPRPAEAGAPHA